jgi:glutathione-specific gamma-glutamylcyclotransferase
LKQVMTEARPAQRGQEGNRDRWIFAYGSLMWRPGFPVLEAAHAQLAGHHRCFCIYSTHHRGSAERPGLVLGLDRGGVCQGIAYRVAGSEAPAIFDYLRARELVNGVYREALVPVTLAGQPRRHVTALAFIVERAHPSYAPRLALSEQARLIRGAKGISGTNLDYLANTMRHLEELGIRERPLERLLVLAGAYVAKAPGADVESPRAAALLRACRTRAVPARRLRPADRRRFLYRTRLSRQSLTAGESVEDAPVSGA